MLFYSVFQRAASLSSVDLPAVLARNTISDFLVFTKIEDVGRHRPRSGVELCSEYLFSFSHINHKYIYVLYKLDRLIYFLALSAVPTIRL